MRNPRGITLVTLVVTIIVLIILAGVSINMVVGDNGIITQAQRAAKETANVTIASEEQMNALVEEMNKYMSEDNNEETEVTISDLQAGDYIKYDTGVEGVGVITCRVLYPADSEYGLQIVSDKNVQMLKLGGTTWAEGKNGYNNAIITLNNEAEKYINLEYATDARCVGSIPTVKSESFVDKDKGTETTVKLPRSTWSSYTRPSGWTSDDTGCYDTDTNYETDKEQMEKFNLWTIGESFWLASRSSDADSYSCSFYVRYEWVAGSGTNGYFGNVHSNGSVAGKIVEMGLRPCILLRSDIKVNAEEGRDGTNEDKAYIIE